MQVILNKDVQGTGKAGDIVKVSDGFARNMLLPKGLAVEATPQNIKQIEKKKKEEAERKAEEKAQAQELKAELEKITLTLKTKAGEGGKVFGSVTSKDIVEALEKEYKIEIDKKKIQLDNSIKTVGEVTVDVKLYQEVIGKLKVNVVAE